jgi:hypothetical protein
VKWIEFKRTILKKEPPEKSDGCVANFIGILQLIETNLSHLKNYWLKDRFSILRFSKVVVVFFEFLEVKRPLGLQHFLTRYLLSMWLSHNLIDVLDHFLDFVAKTFHVRLVLGIHFLNPSLEKPIL